MDEKVRTRIAPSPTGHFHVGTARTALFNYVYAKQHDGDFVLRIEDTDAKRNKPEFETDIIEQMAWLGLSPDETYRQSELVKSHKDAIQKLIDEDKAYISKEPSKEDASKEVAVVRLRNKGETVAFSDLIRGEISFDTAELGDFVIARSIDEPLYHLAVVVDDAEMNITHVIRGEDHISNTPRQMLIGRALGYMTPVYAHLPLILAPDKSKMSKRKHSFAIVKQLREDGFDPKAINNFLMLLGWSPGNDRERFSMDEVIQAFNIQHVHKGGAVFDVEKLKWLNGEYLRKMDENDFAKKALALLEDADIPEFNQATGAKLIPQIKERIAVWSDIPDMAKAGEFDYYFVSPELDKAMLVWKDATLEETKIHLLHIQAIFETAEETVFEDPEAIKGLIWKYAELKGKGAVLWPLRYALSGKERSPDPFSIMSILGKGEVLSRIQNALSYVS
mgnify:CR=1 FL=1